MVRLSTESTPRERLARLIVLLKRTRTFWRSSAAIAAVGLTLALGIALHSKRAWRSETTVLCNEAIKTDREAESATARAMRLGPKLKDLVTARPTLEALVREFGLYPEKVSRSMLDAVEEMQLNVGFRARSADTFVISFVADDPELAQRVTARLAETMIHDYGRQNLDAASVARDFHRRELEQASGKVEDASRALAVFLAQNPQFQWGVNDSPYAPVQAGAAGLPAGPFAPGRRQEGARAAVSADPQLAALQRELGRVEGELAPPAPAAPAASAGGAPSPGPLADAQKRREAAAASLAAAQAGLAEKLLAVTPAHPDAIAAEARVEAARQGLAEAESALRIARASVAAPVEGPRLDLDPARRAELEGQRAMLRRRIADRTARLAAGEPTPVAVNEPADAGSAAPATPPAAASGAPAGGAPSAAAGRSASADIVELETEWHRLRLELERARDQLRTVQASKQSADLSADAAEKESQAEMTILEPAYRPTRPDRGHGRVFLIGAVIATFLALGYAAARVLLDDRLRDEGDLLALGGAPMLVALPVLPRITLPAPRTMIPTVGPPSGPRYAAHASEERPPGDPIVTPPSGRRPVLRLASPQRPARPEAGSDARHGSPEGALMLRDVDALVEAELDEPEVEVVGADFDPEGEGAMGLLRAAPPEAMAALRVLRHRLEQRRRAGAYVVAVVSPCAGEGKTTLAARLAMTLAESERAQVVLVEGHLERPHLAAALGLRVPESAGLSAQVRRHLAGRGKAWELVRVAPSLAVLAEPGPEAAFPAAIHAQQFQEAIEALRRSFDFVVLDGPPVLGSGDANVLEDVADGVVLVVRAAVTRGAALSRATVQLGNRRILGVVLNGAAATADRPSAARTAPAPLRR